MPIDDGEQAVVRLSQRLSRECMLLPQPWEAMEASGRTSSCMSHAATIHVTEYASPDAGPGHLGFTTSICGRFLLAAEGVSISVFEITPTSFLPFATVICPNRVLAVAMDSSSGRCAVAALMDGRCGYVADIDSDGSRQEQPAMYHSLCSPDDPPRSVAICPSRRCIAFGCAAGIELHWIDALSGRNLMKWFPLSATSDFLYFLPARRGIENPNKLRLISSKSGPGQRGGIQRFGRPIDTMHRSVARITLGGGAWRAERVTRENPAEYDHYGAL